MSLAGVVLVVFDEEEKQTNLEQASEAAKRAVHKAAMESVRAIQERNRQRNLEERGCDCPAEKCYASCPRAKTSDFMYWWRHNSPPDARVKDAILHLPAPPAKKGGSRKSKKKGGMAKEKAPLVSERFRLL